jgi:hypothetical protein
MSVTARGQFAQPVDVLVTMLCACASWQKITQSANAAAALTKTIGFGQDSSLARPFANVYLVGAGGDNIGGGSVEAFLPRGTLGLALEIPLEYSGAVTTAGTETSFKASALAGFADDCMNGLQLTITPTGGLEQTVAISDFVGSDGTLTLARIRPAPSLADTFTIAPANARDALVWFLNILGDIVADLNAQAGTGGCISIAHADLKNYGRPERDKEDDDYAFAELEFVKGDAGG